MKQQMNLIKLMETYHSDEKCLEILEDLRWPDGPRCPRCNSAKLSRIYKRGQFDCDSCGYQFSVTAGTIFHNSHLPLRKWFATIYLMVESRKGVSANQIKRTIGVTYKTAWHLCHRIRAAMGQANGHQPLLSGIVEVDETYVGGKAHGKGRGYVGNKTIVVGVLQRGGRIELGVVRGVDRKTLHRFIEKHVAPHAEAIYTDEWPAYKGIADEDTRHETVNHSAEEWVRGDVHTNSIENIWSLLKRSIMGAYHHVSPKHLDAYLGELEWRFNNRKNPYLFRDTLIQLVGADALEYKKLTA